MPATQANEKSNEEDIVDSYKGRGRRRLCKKCKFTCTDAREFTAHLATHSDIESKLDRLRRRRPSVAKTPDGPQSSSDMDSPTSAPLLLEDKEKLKNSFFETPESDAMEVLDEANERDDVREDEGDEPDAMNVDTDEKKLFPHQMGVGESFNPEEEGEGKLVIDDAIKSGQIFPCRQCGQKLDGVKAFLQHLSEAHKVEDKIYKCDLCQYTNGNKEKLARHRKKHFPSTADIFPSESDESVSMNKIQAEKNVYDDMDEEELAVPVTITNIDQRLDDDKKKKKKTRQEVDPGKYFETVDSSGTKYACSQCGNIYKWRKSLNKHWKEKHSSDPLVEVASPPGMLELLKSGKYTQLGARRIYDNVFLSTIKTNKDDNPIDNASPSRLPQSPSPPNFLNTPVSLSASRVVSSLVMPSMIGPFVAGSTQPVFPGMAHPSNGYDSPEEGALDLTRDNKPDMSQFTVKQEFNSSFDQEQPLDFSKKKEEKVKHDKAWQDLKHAHSINQMIPKVHRCSKCEFTSMSEVDFANHTSSHLNKRIVKCNQCKVQINSMDELNNHFLKHHFQKLTEHKEAIKKIPHGLQQTYHLLKMDLQDIGELNNQDLGASEAKSLKCKKCEFEAKWPAELQKHAVSHSEERPYVCMVCGSTYKWKWDLVKHFQKSHPNLPNPYRRNDKRDTPDGSSEEEVEDEPEIKRQKMSNELINGCRDDHISVEGIIAATQAGQRVVSSQPNILDDEPNLDNGLAYLKKLQYLGNGEASQSNSLQMARTPQEILEQQKNLQEAARLRQNSNSAKKIGSREQTSPVPSTSKAEELPYKCTMCNYHARWPSEVTQHMKNHSDSKPYLCPRCEYRSKWKWDVVKHLKRCGGGGINDVIDTTKARRRDIISHGPPNAIVSLQGKLKKLTGAEESGPASSSAQSSGDESRPSSRASTLDLSSNNNENSVTDNNYSNGFASFNSSSNMNSDNTSPSQSPPMNNQPKQMAASEIWSCPHCPFTTASQAELKRHSGLHSDDKPFKCDVCQYSTRWACDLKKHRKSYNHFPKPNKDDKSDNTQGRFKCSQCTLYFQTLQNLMEHRIAEHIGRESLHSSSASQEQSEIDAARIKHPRKPIKQIQCSKCPFVCKNRQTMEKHMEDHTQLELSGFQCFYCSSQFKEKEILLDHMSSHSAFNPKEWETFFMINEEEDQAKDERKEVTAVPGKPEKVLDSTEARIQQILSEIPKLASHPTQALKFRCEWCPAEFSNLTAVYKHASQAHPIQLKEQDVGTAASKSQVQQAASNKKSYAEPIEILKQQIAEKRHEQLAEKLNEMLSNNPKMQQILSKGLEDGSKQFSCDKCSFSSANLATFQRHLQMHGSKQTSQCWFCDYSVDRMQLLYQHMKISHTRKWKALSQDPKFANQIQKMNLAYGSVAVPGNNNDSPPDAVHKGDATSEGHAMDLSSKTKPAEMTHDIFYITKQQYTWSGIPVNVIPVGNALNFVCPHCAFNDASIAKTCAHVMQSHRAMAKFTCKKCQFSDDNIHVMSDHCKTSHPVDERIVEVLDFKQLNFSELQMVQLAAIRDRMELKKTATEENVKMMSCPFCPFKAQVKDDMMKHISNHSKQARYRCQSCDFSSDSTTVISDHVRVHDQGYSFDTKALPLQVKEEKADSSEADKDDPQKYKWNGRIRYRCVVCPYHTTCKSNIMKHKRQHLHNKRYKCSRCSYSAARAVLLKNHLDAHDTQVEDDGLHHDIFCDPNSPNEDLKLDEEEEEMDEDDDSNSDDLDEMDAKAIADLEAKDILEAEAAHKGCILPEEEPGTGSEILDKQFRKQKCPHCPFSSNSGYEYRKHLNFHGTQERYKCDYCSYSLDRLNLLSQHRKLHADEPEFNANPPTADLLNTDFIYKQNISERMEHLEEIEDDQLSCLHCPYKTSKKKSFDIHCNSHGLRRRYICDYCDWSADRLALLCQHRKVHEEELDFLASPEDKVFINHEFDDGTSGEFEAKFMEIKNEEKNSKEGEGDASFSPPFKLTVVKKSYPCQFCPYKSSSKNSYTVHKAMHGSGAEFACTHCSYAACNRGLLQQHMHLHTDAEDSKQDSTGSTKLDSDSTAPLPKDSGPSESQFKCQRCPFKSPSQSQLLEHVSGHLSQDSIQCPCCDFRATSKQVLYPHIEIHFPGSKLSQEALDLMLEKHVKLTNNNNDGESEMPSTGETTKTRRVYVCQYCEREFDAKQAMIQHEKQHLF